MANSGSIRVIVEDLTLRTLGRPILTVLEMVSTDRAPLMMAMEVM